MDFIFWALVFALGFNILVFIPAYLLKTDKLTDISYSLSFSALALLGFFVSSQKIIDRLALILVLVWAIRLGSFLFMRVNKKGKDSRFDAMRAKPWSFFRFWFFQGLTVFVVLLPGLLLWNHHGTASKFWAIAGEVIWATGLGLEWIADTQKYRFGLTNKSKTWIDTGIWRVSRHPNYLGEILVWAGFYIFLATALPGLDKILALASPAYISLVLLFFSGVPLLEKSADKKWGDNKDYREYKKAVPVLIPRPTSLRRLLK